MQNGLDKLLGLIRGSKEISPGFYWIGFILIGLVYIAGAGLIRLMDVDASQYASISMEMFQDGHFLQVFHRGQDYLDKPPFLFWSAIFFYKILGVGEFSYRLSSLLFIFLGAYSTFRLSDRIFGRETALLASLFMLSNQATFLMGHDVRTDTILTGAVIFSIWQIYEFNHRKRFGNLLLASLGIAISMMEKGPIGLVVPILTFFPAWFVEKDWRFFFRWQWLALIILVAIFLVPMSVGLYQQFDLQPEKIVNGRSGVSGLKFFFWEQSFGRITGENVWKDDSTPLFFTHTFLWAFLPWMILAIGGFIDWIIGWIKTFRGEGSPKNNFIFFGFVLTFIAFSLSQFKLPHYINVILPLSAIFAADFAIRVSIRGSGSWHGFFIGQQVVNFLLLVVCLAVSILFFPLTNPLLWLAFILLLFASGILLTGKQSKLMRLVGPSLMIILAANLILNTHFYPELLKFQPGSMAANFINSESLPKRKIRKLEILDHEDYHMHSLDFYIKTQVPYINPEQINKESTKELIFFVDGVGKDFLEESLGDIVILKEFDQFNVTQLNFQFLLPSSRESQLGKRYLIKGS